MLYFIDTREDTNLLVLVSSCLLMIIGQITLKDEYYISDEINALQIIIYIM